MKISYRPEQSVDANKSYSPSAQKPRLFMEAAAGLPHVEVASAWEPVPREDFYAVHDRMHVDSVLDCVAINGFGNRIREVADSLPYTTGSLLDAARNAAAEGIAMSPTSGFHHATFDECMGFCTFNGLMAAAVRLKREKRAERIGIVDFDMHWGNGVVDIVSRLGIGYVDYLAFSDQVGNDYDAWLDGLYVGLGAAVGSCDLILYQAGADPHVDDPLGGELSTEQMRLRDRIVFRFAKDMGKPLAWNLAGGYQRPVQKVLELHLNTLKECLAVYG